MKLSIALLAVLSGASVNAFTSSSFVPKFGGTTTNSISSSSAISMVLEKKEKKLSKIEVLKINSDHLKAPLLEVCFVYWKGLIIVHFWSSQKCIPFHCFRLYLYIVYFCLLQGIFFESLFNPYLERWFSLTLTFSQAATAIWSRDQNYVFVEKQMES